jgi:exodeoxyribonuclease V alpha subunit
LSPLYRGPLGIDNLNQELKKVLNPECREVYQEFGEGDVVVFLKNNASKGYYNGDFGRIVGLTKAGLSVKLTLTEGTVVIPTHEVFETLKLGYCISVHRAQGNEYGIVLLPVHPGFGRMLQRTILYTAVTRARDKAVLIGNKDSYVKSVQNASEGQRVTGLRGFITGEYSSSSV